MSKTLKAGNPELRSPEFPSLDSLKLMIQSFQRILFSRAEPVKITIKEEMR